MCCLHTAFENCCKIYTGSQPWSIVSLSRSSLTAGAPSAIRQRVLGKQTRICSSNKHWKQRESNVINNRAISYHPVFTSFNSGKTQQKFHVFLPLTLFPPSTYLTNYQHSCDITLQLHTKLTVSLIPAEWKWFEHSTFLQQGECYSKWEGKNRT